MEKKIKIIAIIVLIAFLIISRTSIRYFISGGNDVVLFPPDTIAFYLATDIHQGELYYLSDEPYNETGKNDGYDNTTKTYHLFVEELYLENNDAFIYATGSCWNYPKKPVVKVNGKTIEDVSSKDTGRAESIFGMVYIDKLYHFEYFDKIIANHTYEFYVRCNQRSETIYVIFHSK